VDKTGRRDSKESNFDSQISLSGCSFDGSSNPTTYKSATFGFDPEDRLTSISSPAFSAAYDGDGLRVRKTTASGTTYFLYDGGSLIAEESYSNAAASFKSLNGWTADGWRTRYDESSSQAYCFAFDPQGNLVQRQNPHAYAAGAGAYDETIYEGYGALRQDAKVYPSAVAQYDPVGFGGQFGYYTDTETGLLCLTHRYYDPGTGKFVNRDPIGYKGGINLYGFTGNNPVNESDPSGFEPRIKGDPDDPTGLPRDDEGHWHGSTMNPSVHDGTHEARRVNAMRRSAVSVFFGALLAVIFPEGKAIDSGVEALQEARIARAVIKNQAKVAERAAWEARMAAKAVPPLKPAQILANRASALGYARRLPPQPFSHGQDVFHNGTSYISQDIDGHNVANGWKMFNRRGVRLGTYDSQLNRIGD